VVREQDFGNCIAGALREAKQPTTGGCVMSLPYHKVDWDLVHEVRRLQGRVQELDKQVAELHRLVSRELADRAAS
jgi:hypothetical protein